MARLRLSFTMLAAVLICLLAIQIGTNIRIDAEEAAGRLTDRIAFYAMLALGGVLVIGRRASLIRLRALVPSTLFFLYLVVVVQFTTDGPLLALVLPNYGVVSWTLLGVACNLAITTIALRIERAPPSSPWQLVLWAPTLALGSLFLALRDYALNPGRVLSYQFPAANLIVLLLFGLLALDRWQGAQSPRPHKFRAALPAIAFLSLGTVLSYFVSRMNSTAIVAVWAILSVILVWRFGFTEGWRTMTLFLVVLVGAAHFASSSSLVDEFFSETRFGQLRGGHLLEFSSLTTRADVLPTFGRQFSVSPIFGHMEAEVVAGYAPGNYVHSMPLSALTHTGIVGSLLLLLTLISSAGIGQRSDHDRFPILLFGVIVLCATIFAFFTWIPLWFMVGYLAVKTRTAWRHRSAQ